MKADVTSTTDLERVLEVREAVIGTLGPRNKTDPICANAAKALVSAMNTRSVILLNLAIDRLPLRANEAAEGCVAARPQSSRSL